VARSGSGGSSQPPLSNASGRAAAPSGMEANGSSDNQSRPIQTLRPRFEEAV